MWVVVGAGAGDGGGDGDEGGKRGVEVKSSGGGWKDSEEGVEEKMAQCGPHRELDTSSWLSNSGSPRLPVASDDYSFSVEKTVKHFKLQLSVVRWCFIM